MCLDDGVGIVSVPNYACFDKRLLTFTGWSIERPSPVDLAKAGFYYIGFGDSVECFYCKVRICAWEISDIPIKEHSLTTFPLIPSTPGALLVLSALMIASSSSPWNLSPLVLRGTIPM
jgi:hypothetical protein